MEGEWRREEVERAGQVQLGGEVGIAESARGDSVIVGAAPRTGSQAREKKKGPERHQRNLSRLGGGLLRSCIIEGEKHRLAAPLSETGGTFVVPLAADGGPSFWSGMPGLQS